MSDFWSRVYTLEVGNDSEVLTVDGMEGEPARVTFNITTHADSYIQTGEITVYGLSAENRRKLYDIYTSVKLVAGYPGLTGQIFSGNIYNVSIGRDGPEVFVTLYCRATGFVWDNARINKSWGENTPAKDIIRDVAATFDYPVEFVGDFEDLPPLIEGLTMSQDSKSAMRDLASNYSFSWTVVSGQTVIARLGAQRQGESEIYLISAATGMVGSPRILEYGIDVTSKMNPKIRLYDQVEVENTTAELLFADPTIGTVPDTIGVGTYTVRAISYIGDNYGASWDTVIEGWSPRNVQLSRTGQ